MSSRAMNGEAGKANGSVEAAAAKTTAPDLKVPNEKCLTADRLEPCTIVIVGASGDLTARKLLPALFDLFLKGVLPDAFAIVGCSKTRLSDEQFRNKMRDAVSKSSLTVKSFH